MTNFLLKEICTDNIQKELEQIGFDIAYRHIAKDKFFHKNIKIFNLTPAQANILKQTALIFGADCAVNRDVITGKIEKSDVILCGSFSQLKKISEKLQGQPFKLRELSSDILEILNRKTHKTKLAGILNVTPDSFSDGGLYFNPKDAEKHLIELIEDGADIIDIGAESTKPFSYAVEEKEQIERLKPILSFIQKENINIPISVDTRSSIVAEFALDNGVAIINDVSGFDFDSKMPEIISKYKATAIIQHSQGTPDNMQVSPHYNNVVEEIYLSLRNKIILSEDKGIENIIIDPGIGFGKTKENNFEILNRVEEFFTLNRPIMIGVSRKRIVGEAGNNELKDSLSLAISYPLIQQGIDYLRVHNVKLHKSLLKIL